MDKKTAQAVVLVIFSGVLFLQSFMVGKVADEETGMVLNAMRSLRRVDNLEYRVDMTYMDGQEQTVQTQKMWADLLTGKWAEECSNSDVDGTSIIYRIFCDGKRVFYADMGDMWYEDDTISTEIPNFDSLTNLSYATGAVEASQQTNEEGQKQVVFILTDDHLEQQKKVLLDAMVQSDDSVLSGDTQENVNNPMALYYEQYKRTTYENVKVVYTIDANHVLTGMEYTMNATRPKIVTVDHGNQELKGKETFQIGASVQVVEYGTGSVKDKIEEYATEAGYTGH